MVKVEQSPNTSWELFPLAHTMFLLCRLFNKFISQPVKHSRKQCNYWTIGAQLPTSCWFRIVQTLPCGGGNQQFAGSTVDIDKLEFHFFSLLLEVIMSIEMLEKHRQERKGESCLIYILSNWAWMRETWHCQVISGHSWRHWWEAK